MADAKNKPILPTSPFLFLLHFPFRIVLGVRGMGRGLEKFRSSQRMQHIGTFQDPLGFLPLLFTLTWKYCLGSLCKADI